jgi:hypothetical protein
MRKVQKYFSYIPTIFINSKVAKAATRDKNIKNNTGGRK